MKDAIYGFVVDYLGIFYKGQVNGKMVLLQRKRRED